MSKRLEGKIAIVTGAGAGFGAGIARKFAHEGARVIVADLDEAKAEAVASEVGGLAIVTNVTDSESIEALVFQTTAKYGRIDILVNNAGTSHVSQPLESVEEKDFERVMSVNMRSIYLTTSKIVPKMKAQGGGVILNIASTSGIRPRPGLVWYGASKGWVITATKAMAIELAGSGIRANAICPAAGDTQLFRDLLGGKSLGSFEETIPLGRLVTPDDVAEAACYLCEDAASIVTGVALEVDGGRCI